jgi:predicted transcriptional regulator
MTTNTASGSLDAISLASAIVAAYVSNNAVRTTDLPEVIASVHAAITGLSSGGIPAVAAPKVAVERPSAPQIRKSIHPDGLVSFIDGKTYKTLKRHLTSHGLDPRTYRERYGLPADYPMVAPNYAAQRSALAKAIGLGRPGALAEREETGRGRDRAA